MQRLIKIVFLLVSGIAFVVAGNQLLLGQTTNAAIAGAVTLIMGFMAVRRPRGAKLPDPKTEVPEPVATETPLLDDIPARVLREIAQAPPPPPPPEPVDVAPTPVAPDDTLILVYAELDGLHTSEELFKEADRFVENRGLAPLSDADLVRIGAKLDAKGLKAKHLPALPGVAFARRIRADLDPRFSGTSWMGGAPTASSHKWPRCNDDVPMHHLAQIDLSTLPVSRVPLGFPQTGALSFFVATTGPNAGQGTVQYLPNITNKEAKEPDDLRPLFGGGVQAGLMAGLARTMMPKRFVRWPLDLIALPIEPRGSRDGAQSVMAEMLPLQSEEKLSLSRYFKDARVFSGVFFWDAAQRFVGSLTVARSELNDTLIQLKQQIGATSDDARADIEALGMAAQSFADTIEEARKWAFANKRWTLMKDEDIDVFLRFFESVRSSSDQPAPFEAFYHDSSAAFTRIDEALQATLLSVVSTSPYVFESLPIEIQADVDTYFRLPKRGQWHQMFGQAISTAVVPEEFTAHFLLLQIHTDAILGMEFGPERVLQFWIAPDDLKAGDWDKVQTCISKAE